ncbi:MAG: hypothetical protein HY658_00865, partial [Actinobacteria bacterium]|nr:hypothetical protein [Actinomycetota bacterium]
WWAWAIGVAVLVGVGITALALVSGQGDPDERGLSPPPTTTTPPPTVPTSPSPSVTATPSASPRSIRTVAAFDGFAEGKRVEIRVVGLPPLPRDECVGHEIGNGPVAYQSDCTSWEEAGYDLYFFRFEFRNLSGRAVVFERNRVMIVARDGRVYRPVNVSDVVQEPDEFWSLTERIVAGRTREAWITFDGSTDFRPARFTYRDGNQRLTIVFVGEDRPR